MFVFFGGVQVRAEHITTIAPIFDHGEHAGSARYVIRISLVNGEELTDSNASMENSNVTYNRLLKAVGI
ncbi:hypothetical protein [Stenotrophomonas maltophilia]|uniref:hypothetical protein n=1 Tax=Stenotrophomonas maltophilia TaxID=40324 RepID=UPI0016550ED0|nr:hypothetical protein [Stenotrophomonas maltophilia]MBC8772353.1 hypothetical protein [Stenotrophomonas maltophilia]